MGRRTRLIGAAVGAMLALMALPAVAAADRVDALGTITQFQPNYFSVHASDEDGSPSGNVFFIEIAKEQFRINGTVKCMRVEGNRAFLVYRDRFVKKTNGTVGGFVILEDNGPNTGTPVDRQRNGRLTKTAYKRERANGCQMKSVETRLVTAGEIFIEDTP